MKIPSRARLINAIADAGYTMVSADLGGVETWGNDTAVGRITEAKTFLQSQPSVLAGPVILVGQSMGAMNSLVWAARFPASVKCIVCAIPVVNLSDLRERLFKASIDGAYGGTYSDAAFGSQHSPYVMAASNPWSGIPIQIWYGDSDMVSPPAFVASLGRQTPSAELRLVRGGHAESTVEAIPPDQVLAFMAR
ncbi:alpha/beta hydrolase [Luteibacter yeojuensis]|uniref:Alpha/beta hydrolase n=2 Tax=Luteibacter yeojuensis TaxID=345309 RepID=A0A7X5QS55_9GAMM|nr:alpha/beta hydrolase-fold protein [Luteibacter yeojuensis]NID14410.1 alpha/beta hydrolase [Luteibacter yeojuensis]